MDSLISRFDPKYRCDFICNDDNDISDQTIFKLRPLTVFEYKYCEEISTGSNIRIGEYTLRTLLFGLTGWSNFRYANGEVIQFSQANISAIPIINQAEISSAILNISEPEEDLVEELKFLAKWSDWVSKSKNESQWNCRFCIEKKFQNARNCGGDQPNTCPRCKTQTYSERCPDCNSKTSPKFKHRFSNAIDDFVTRCPLSIITSRAVTLTNLISFMNESNSLPFSGGSLEQTNFYYAIRSIVLSEQNSLLKKELDNSESK